jgi:signal transduction histidine kinase
LLSHHEQDRQLLFLEKLYKGGEEEFDVMTSFFVRRSVIFTFFGKLARTGVISGTSHYQPQDPGVGQEMLEREDQERLEQAAREEAEQAVREQAEQAAREQAARDQAEQKRIARELE